MGVDVAGPGEPDTILMFEDVLEGPAQATDAIRAPDDERVK